MSPEKTAVLGAIAGFTIYFGLPVGRLQGLGDRTRAFLSVLAAGILLFILARTFSSEIKIKKKTHATAGIAVVVSALPSGCSSSTRTPCGGKS